MPLIAFERRKSITALAYDAGARVAAILPAWGARGVGSLAGWACWAMQPKRRARLRANYARLHPDAPPPALGALTRRAYADFGASVADTLRLASLSRERLRAEVRVQGIEHLHAGVASGGAVVIAAHTGNWEWGGAALAARGIPVAAVARSSAEPADRFFSGMRLRFGIRTAPAWNELPTDVRGVFVVFCDRGTARDPRRDPLRIAQRAVALASRRGWAAIPALVVREGDGYCVRVGAPLSRAQRAAERAAAARQALAYLAGELRRSPAQWFAFAPAPRGGAVVWPQ